MSKTILHRIKRLEASASLLLEEATAIRADLEGGASRSPKGKANSKVIANILTNRRKTATNGI